MLRRVLAAKRASLQQHQASATDEGCGAGVFQGLEALSRIVAIQGAEAHGGPSRIHNLLHQGIDGPLAGRFVIAPVDMDGR